MEYSWQHWKDYSGKPKKQYISLLILHIQCRKSSSQQHQLVLFYCQRQFGSTSSWQVNTAEWKTIQWRNLIGKYCSEMCSVKAAEVGAAFINEAQRGRKKKKKQTQTRCWCWVESDGGASPAEYYVLPREPSAFFLLLSFFPQWDATGGRIGVKTERNGAGAASAGGGDVDEAPGYLFWNHPPN